MAGRRRRRVPAPGGRTFERPPVVTAPSTDSVPGYQMFERPAPVLVPEAGWIPDDLLEGLPFTQLDTELPLLLLPVRLETRYQLDADPPALRIRIYPDQVHVRIDTDPATGARQPARPVLLPRQWLAIGYRGGEAVFQQPGRPVAEGLRTGPDAGAATWDVAGTGLRIDDAMAWMADYDRAVQAGMAITVPLTGAAAAAADGLDVLLVVGVDATTDPSTAAGELADLLRAQSSTAGLSFVPQGTPTNNTAGVSAGTATPAAEAARTGRGPGARTAPTDDWIPDKDQTLPPPGVPVPGSQDNGSRFARALGLGAAADWQSLPFGEDADYTRSRWTRIALFEAVLGTYLRRLLRVGDQDGVGPQAVDTLRDWFVDHVTAGAPLPCVRIGSQPYGILPVRRSTPPDATAPAGGVAGEVERVIGLLIDQWRIAAAELPVLDPGAADTGDDEAVSEAIGTVLATQPHPARLFLRSLEQYSMMMSHEQAATAQGFYRGMLLALDPPGGDALVTPWLEIAQLLALHGLAGHLNTIDGQLSAWNEIADALPDAVDDEDLLEDGLAFVDTALWIVGAYEQRQRPLRWAGLDRFEGAIGQQNTELIEGDLSAGSSEWGPVGLVEAPDATSGQTAADYLTGLVDRFDARNGTMPPPGPEPDPKPLLYQLLDGTLDLVPTDAATSSQVRAALVALAELDVTTLDWLLRETLGLGIHRLDAWTTSLASERLDRLRTARATGIQVGGFGWVTDLAPRPAGVTSAGHVLTPSLAHATTAAVLRSGWQAHGTDDPASPTSVDARSHRVRTAAWLLDGVRAGQDLGDLLGYRFERTLHDLGADEDIRTVRRRVLTETGHGDVEPDQPVDGIELIELHRGGSLDGLSAAATRALDLLERTFDSVNDVALVEAVHQLTTGNHERATAMLDAVSLGTHTPPELRSPRTPLSGLPIEHRVVVLLDPNPPAAGPPAAGGWAAGGRAAAAPALEAWVAGLLPAAGAVGVTGVSVSADGSRHPFRLTTADLGISALDAIYLAGDDPLAVPAPLAVLAAAVADPSAAAELDPADPGTATVSLAEFSLLAAELRRGLQSWRVLDRSDLLAAHVEPGDTPPDASGPAAAASGIVAEYRHRLDELASATVADDVAAVVAPVAWLARHGVAAGGAPADLACAARCAELAWARLDSAAATVASGGSVPDPGDRPQPGNGPVPHDKPLPGDGPVPDTPRPGDEPRPGGRPAGDGERAPGGKPPDDEPVPGDGKPPVGDLRAVQERRLAALLGARLPLLASFDRPAGEGAVRLDAGLADAETVDEWLEAVGRVRADVGRLTTAATLSVLLTDGQGVRALPGQQPASTGERWAAVSSPPAGTGGRLCLTAVVTGNGPPSEGGPVCGLAVDRWVERIPSTAHVAGLALQFDAPSNKPPQSWLLAVPPDGEPWNLSLVAATLLETLEWAALRSVGPEDLLDYGRALPTVYGPLTMVAWPKEQS